MKRFVSNRRKLYHRWLGVSYLFCFVNGGRKDSIAQYPIWFRMGRSNRTSPFFERHISDEVETGDIIVFVCEYNNSVVRMRAGTYSFVCFVGEDFVCRL